MVYNPVSSGDGVKVMVAVLAGWCSRYCCQSLHYGSIATEYDNYHLYTISLFEIFCSAVFMELSRHHKKDLNPNHKSLLKK